MSSRFSSLTAIFVAFSDIGTAVRASREYSRLSTTTSAGDVDHRAASRLLPR